MTWILKVGYDALQLEVDVQSNKFFRLNDVTIIFCQPEQKSPIQRKSCHCSHHSLWVFC